MELDWVETFLAVVDRGGFTAASSQVHRSQSRVSAHIAALERELGVQLIDRTRRPAKLTPAGRVFAQHARDIIATVGSARASVGVLRAMNEESLPVLTTPCIGGSMFPGVIATVLHQHPRARVALAEHGWLDLERPATDDGFVLAVLPTVGHPLPQSLREQLLWREPIMAVVPIGHPLAAEPAADGPGIDPLLLAGHPLIVGGASTTGQSDIAVMATAHGLQAAPRTMVDTPGTLVAMVRGGVGIGLLNSVAVRGTDTSGTVAIRIDHPALVREVALYFYDVVLASAVGRSLKDAVLQAPPPAGAIPVGPSRLRSTPVDPNPVAHNGRPASISLDGHSR